MRTWFVVGYVVLGPVIGALLFSPSVSALQFAAGLSPQLAAPDSRLLLLPLLFGHAFGCVAAIAACITHLVAFNRMNRFSYRLVIVVAAAAFAQVGFLFSAAISPSWMNLPLGLLLTPIAMALVAPLAGAVIFLVLEYLFRKQRQAAAPNPSVKGTSCGRPQAATFVER